jgi:hypothetical protein
MDIKEGFESLSPSHNYISYNINNSQLAYFGGPSFTLLAAGQRIDALRSAFAVFRPAASDCCWFLLGFLHPQGAFGVRQSSLPHSESGYHAGFLDEAIHFSTPSL